MENDLFEESLTLKNVLESHATGKYADESEYRRIRAIFIAHPSIKQHLPQFVRNCRTLGDFWAYIKPKFTTYAERRKYLTEQFADLFDFLEATDSSPIDTSSSKFLKSVDAPYVTETWAKALGSVPKLLFSIFS